MSNQLIDSIGVDLDEIQDWDPETFDFNSPISIFSDEIDMVNINSLMIPPNFNELKDLAKDADNRSIKLNNDQLHELRTKGKISIPSKNFEGQNHVWNVSKFLQSGTDNIKNSFYDGLANACEHYVISIPERIHEGRHLTIKNALKEIKCALCNITGYFVGGKYKKNENPNYIIHTKLNEYVERTIVSSLINSENADKQILFDFENGNHIGVSMNMYRVFLKKIAEPYKDFLEQWDKCAASREKKLFEKYKNADMTREEIIKHVINQENQVLQEKILELINHVLPSQEANILTNLFTCVYELRNYIAKYENNKKEAINEYQITLQNKHQILYRIDKWKNKKINNFEQKWLKKYPIEDELLKIAENFVGQEKHIFISHLKIKKSIEYLNFQKKITKSKIADRTYCYQHIIWNHKKWAITKKNNDYVLQKYKSIKNYSDNTYWRISNLLKRSSCFFNNGSYALISNMLMGPFGLRSLFGLGDFNSDYKLSNNGELISKHQYKTWFGRICNLWKNISQSRVNFENRPENGILGKSFTRIFNILYNYLAKGVIGTVMIGIGHPLLVIINTIVSLIGTITSPLWSIIASVVVYIWCLLVYDVDAPETQEYQWFPIVRTIINNLLIKGMGQLFVSSLAIGSQGICGVLSLTWTIFCTTIKYCYDFGMYHLVLRHKAKVPSADDFLVKRISGPGLSSKYFYLINHQIALTMVQYVLEEMEMEAYKIETKTKINEPRNKLLQYYNQFTSLGLQINNNSDRVKKFTKTKNQLENKLKQIENDYWSNHKIKGNFKNNGKIRMDQQNLSVAIKYATEMCETFVNEKILPRLGESTQIMFWVDKKLEENDWNGLATCCLVTAFGSGIMQPFENTDKDGFRLIVKDINAGKFLLSLFDGDPLENLPMEEFVPMSNLSNAKSDIQVVTPDNLLSRHSYESMLFINDDYFKKENQMIFEYAERDNSELEIQSSNTWNQEIELWDGDCKTTNIPIKKTSEQIVMSNLLSDNDQPQSSYDEYLEMNEAINFSEKLFSSDANDQSIIVDV
jgi:hypothetical protein